MLSQLVRLTRDFEADYPEQSILIDDYKKNLEIITLLMAKQSQHFSLVSRGLRHLIFSYYNNNLYRNYIRIIVSNDQAQISLSANTSEIWTCPIDILKNEEAFRLTLLLYLRI